VTNLVLEKFSLGDLTSFLDESDDTAAYLFNLPTFQRGEVWSDDKKRDLVDSVLKEYPIGSILLFVSGIQKTRQIVDVVDGLQRSSTLVDFARYPLSYLSVSRVFPESFLEEIEAWLYPANPADGSPDRERSIDRILDSWFRDVREISEKKFSATKCISKLMEVHPDSDSVLSQTLREQFDDEFSDARDRIKAIFKYEIPAVIYRGNAEDIPEIFERINSRGKKLDKYEIFASSWATRGTLIKNKKVREKLEDRYKEWIEKDWIVKGFDPVKGIGERDANFHEYLLGLSQHLVDQFPDLYKFQKDNSESSVAFVIATYAFGLRNSEMAHLPAKFPKDASGLIDPTTFESALFEVSKLLDNSLGALKLRLNKTTQQALVPHSQNQIVSIVAASLSNGYELSTWKLSNKANRDKVIKYAPSHYIRDILQSAWSGSGDSRAYRTVWDDSQGSRISPSSYYLSPVNKSDFDVVFENWNSEQLKKAQTDRPNTSKEAKVVLMFAYAGIVSVQVNAQVTFEIEHLYPVQYIKEKIGTSGIGWPISAIGNLALLEKKINKIKGKKLLGDYIPELVTQGKITQPEIDQINQFVVSPDYAGIVDDPQLNLDSFRTFCGDRAIHIRDLIVKHTSMP
jgi:hypothetical protein